MQKEKALFDELIVAGRLVLLEDFNLYVFHGLWGELKYLVASLATKAEPLSYPDLHSHLLTHKLLHKTSCKTSRRKIINWLVSCKNKFITLDRVIRKFWKFAWSLLIWCLNLGSNFWIFREIQKFDKKSQFD